MQLVGSWSGLRFDNGFQLLSPKERAILALSAGRKTNREAMASEVDLTIAAVDQNKRRIREKMNIQSREEFERVARLYSTYLHGRKVVWKKRIPESENRQLLRLLAENTGYRKIATVMDLKITALRKRIFMMRRNLCLKTTADLIVYAKQSLAGSDLR